MRGIYIYTSLAKTLLPCYQQGSPCQSPAGNWTTRRPPDDRKETQTEVVWSCVTFIKTGQNHHARHSDRGKKTRQKDEEVGIQHQGTDRPGLRQVPEGSEEQREMEETGCEIICGASTTLAVKGLMMMMMYRDQREQTDFTSRIGTQDNNVQTPELDQWLYLPKF